ncbi:Spherulin-1A 1 [Zalerion maritima]|uniref:Spherulin-1A 1 n=1 Tax=Zalerion maritima TaxID=339359 RepID=A0AAD5RKA4_9PEZI|nr:Spherulin-1A 1 [Zalerion maritima]
MQFTSAIIAAILAYTTAAAPASNSQQPATTMATYTTAAAPSATAEAAGASPYDLSLTQKLFLADTAADRFSLLPENSDFVFNFPVDGPGPGEGGNLVAANRASFPALVSTGSGMALGRIGGCGINTFHVHPRAAELQVVVRGRIVTEMIPENGVLVPDPEDPSRMIRRVIRTELGLYDMTPFYQGSAHAQFNPGCDDAVFVAGFNSEDFGAGQIADELFAFDEELVAATLGEMVDGRDVEGIRDTLPVSIVRGVEECLAKCNKQKRSV